MTVRNRVTTLLSPNLAIPRMRRVTLSGATFYALLRTFRIRYNFDIDNLPVLDIFDCFGLNSAFVDIALLFRFAFSTVFSVYDRYYPESRDFRW